MGNSGSRPTVLSQPQDLRVFFNSDLPKLALQTKVGKHGLIGDSKFMKTFLMKADGQSMVVKVYFRLADEDLTAIQVQLHQLWLNISPTKYPNLLPHQMWISSRNKNKNIPTPVYLLRQYISSNLFDRSLTRPFLTEMEKLWLIYQMFLCLEICHEKGVVHGDVKPENFLITNSDFVVLTDFAPFKPTLIANDDPTDFQYFFDSSSRHSCYVAPERFVASAEIAKSQQDQNYKKRELLPAMDVFSLGCTIAEILLDCKISFLDLPGMMTYLRLGETELFSLDHSDSPALSALSRIKSDNLRSIIVHMTQRDASKRLSIKEYKNILLGKELHKGIKCQEFPLYFEETLYPLYMDLHWDGMTPDRRVEKVFAKVEIILESIMNSHADNKKMVVPQILKHILQDSELNEIETKNIRKSYLNATRRQNSNKLMKIRCKKQQSDVVSHDELDLIIKKCDQFVDSIKSKSYAADYASDEDESVLKSDSDIQNPISFFNSIQLTDLKQVQHGFTLLVQLITANFRNLRFPVMKVKCVMLLVHLGSMCEDEVILQRIVPIYLHCLEDTNNAHVRATALRALTESLKSVNTISSSEADIFPLYILPALNRLVKDQEIVVRVAFAECLGRLAEVSKKFLDKAHFISQKIALSKLKDIDENKESFDNTPPQPPIVDIINDSSDDGNSSLPMPPIKRTVSSSVLPSLRNGFDFPYGRKLRELHDTVAAWIKYLSDDSTAENRKGSGLSSNLSQVKRILLEDIMRVCVFFGQDATISLLLPHLLTFFSDQDWELRLAFWKSVVGVCGFVGSTFTEAYILPGLDHALVDVEDRVVVGALQFLKSLCQVKLISVPIFVTILVQKAAAMLLHPTAPIRQEMSNIIVSFAKQIGKVDSAILLMPIIRPVLRDDTFANIDISDEFMNSSAVIFPIERKAYRKALLERQKKYLDNKKTEKNENSTVSFSSSIQDDDCEVEVEKIKIQIMSDYLNASARELTTKTMQWRHALSSNINSGFFSASLRRSLSPDSVKGSLDTLLSVTSTHSLNQSLQTMMIPHQKFGAGFFYPLTEEQRFLSNNIDKLQDPASICALFGISSSQYDAVRAVNSDLFQKSSDQQTTTTTGSSIEDGNDTTVALINDQIRESSLNASALALAKRVQALKISPIPPDVGTLLQPVEDKKKYYNGYIDPIDLSETQDYIPNGPNKQPWRPKENTLVFSVKEHTQCVNRLAVCPDQSFFGSASSDGTVKIWQLNGINALAHPQSSITYKRHKSPVIDIATIENSHSMASASQNGSIHVWRVDVDNKKYDDPERKVGLGVIGMGVMTKVDSNEGKIMGLQHFNGESASILAYITENGGLHGWDLRSSKEAFNFKIRPELGYATSMAFASDRSWICVGTSKGFIILYDLRYDIMCKLWRHSSGSTIWRLACSKSLSASNRNIYAPTGSPALADTEGAYLFVSAGKDETAVWGLPEAGECIKCFRSVPLENSRKQFAKLPTLTEIALPRHPGAVITEAYRYPSVSDEEANEGNAIRAMIGRTPIHLITAGADRMIRFWDFKSPAKCFTVAGLEPGQPKPTFEAPTSEGLDGRLFVCYDSALPSLDASLPSHLPLRGDRGPLTSNGAHTNDIMDLKSIDVPIKGLLSCSKDGIIKLWR